jgi:hypothetical protein
VNTAKSIVDFLPEELFNRVKNQILAKGMGPDGNHFYHTVAGRWLTEIHFDEATEIEILDIAKKIFGKDNLRRAGFHTARYQMQGGIKPQLWKHWDQSACQYSLDLCIEKTVDWKLVVEEEEFDEQPNTCVIFSGNDMLHWRTPYPSTSENDYVTLLFMQFAEPEHWFFTEGGSEGFNRHGHEADFKFRARMGYWSQPDYSDGRPICKCCDYRPVLNFEERYQNEKDIWEAWAKAKYGNN